MTNQPQKPLMLYGKMLTFTRIKLVTNDLEQITDELDALLGDKKSQIPVLIDSEVHQDLPALLDVFWAKGLQPIGVVSGIMDSDAKANRLPIFPSEGNRLERVTPTPTTIASDHMIHEQMLRSGQSINHVGGDLIVTGSVNQGAEVITDNSLHIYGRAKGRLVAGATGDKNARIFCQQFNPSLVSVAGTYCLHDDIPKDVLDKPVQVSFVEGEGLKFHVMGESDYEPLVALSAPNQA